MGWVPWARETKMTNNIEPVGLSEVVDSEAFIDESVAIFFDPLGEGWSME